MASVPKCPIIPWAALLTRWTQVVFLGSSVLSSGFSPEENWPRWAATGMEHKTWLIWILLDKARFWGEPGYLILKQIILSFLVSQHDVWVWIFFQEPPVVNYSLEQFQGRLMSLDLVVEGSCPCTDKVSWAWIYSMGADDTTTLGKPLHLWVIGGKGQQQSFCPAPCHCENWFALNS